MEFLSDYIYEFLDLTIDFSEEREETFDEMAEFELYEGILVE